MPSGIYKRIKPGYWLGKKLSKTHKEKISKGTSKGRQGIKFSVEHIKNLSLSHKGQRAWCAGKKCPQLSDENHHEWKGDNVGYSALHSWVKRKLGKPETCEHCNKTKLKSRQIHWANKSHRYLRDKNDWIRLCVKCHKKYDKKK